MWYVMQACKALDVSLDDVIAGNVEKPRKDIPEVTLTYITQRIEQQMIDDLLHCQYWKLY